MATVEFRDKENFMQRAAAINRRVEGITRNNTMAGLLNNNFKKWLGDSAMSPVKLTEELDTNKDGFISGDEFATLLGKMTGERPPEWVVELVFSFVNANVNDGIPIRDWMAFLAASGMEFPDELFEEKVEVTGAIGILEDTYETGQQISVSVSFNVEVVAYEFSVFDNATRQEIHASLIPNTDMDRPDFDEFVIELDEAGNYTAELRHLGVRLDTHMFTVLPAPVEPVVEHVEEAHAPVEVHEAPSEPVVDGFESFVAHLESMKLRSEAQAAIGESATYGVSAIVQSISRTLLGVDQYRNGFTAHCTTGEGTTFRMMLKPTENPPAAGQTYEVALKPHDWDVALKQLICLEA